MGVRLMHACYPALQAMVGSYCRTAAAFERPGLECCAAAGWVRQRLAASYRALQDYQHQRLQQLGKGRGWSAALGGRLPACLPSSLRAATPCLLPCSVFALHSEPSHQDTPPPPPPRAQLTEELAAAEARRPAALVVQPTMRLHLPGALQHPPLRLQMCSKCALRIEAVRRGAVADGWWAAGWGAACGYRNVRFVLLDAACPALPVPCLATHSGWPNTFCPRACPPLAGREEGAVACAAWAEPAGTVSG